MAPAVRLELLTCRQEEVDWGTEELEKIFDRVHWISIDAFRPRKFGAVCATLPQFDLIDLQYHQSGALIDTVRRIWPQAAVVYSPMESLIRASVVSIRNLWGATGLFRARPVQWKKWVGQIWNATQEARYIRKADRVICVSETDQKALAWIGRPDRLYCVPTGLSPLEFSKDPERAFSLQDSQADSVQSIVFVAYFGSQTNREALIWYCNNVHSKLRQLVRNYELQVVGRGLDEDLIKCCKGEGIHFVGAVNFIGDALSKASIGIAPALSGGGVRGKIHQYAAAALPCVASRIAWEGMAYQPCSSILVADSEQEFLEKCLLLLRNPSLGRRIGRKANEICMQNYAWSSMGKQIAAAYKLD